MTDTDTKVRCSAWARQVELSPIATVGSYDGYLLVETPLPWPRDIAMLPALASVADALGERNIRIQALVPGAMDAAPDQHRVVLHVRRPSESGFSGYERFETTAGASVVNAVERLLAAAAEPATANAGGLRSPAADVLVCTHGRRDVCCGAQGTDLALQLVALGADDGVTYRRTSHTGGHRFAPTFVVLPQGTGWAFADVSLVERVLGRTVPFADVAPHYRGCAGLGGPAVQAVEREVLVDVGWELLDRPRHGYPTGEATAGGGTVVRLEAGTDRWEAVVGPGRTLPVPDCMKPLSEARKTETEWVVTDLRPLS